MPKNVDIVPSCCDVVKLRISWMQLDGLDGLDS